MDPTDPLSIKGDELGERARSPERSPGVGAICAATVHLAASLVVSAARASADVWSEAGAAAAQAESLRLRSARLAGANAATYAEALAALRRALAGPPSSDQALAEALDAAAATPHEIAQVAADLAEIAAVAAAESRPELRPEAAGAAQLVAGAARTCAGLVRVNLITRPDDRRSQESEAAAGRARLAAERAMEAIEEL